MFKHQLVGRLGFFVIVLVLANACGDGEISDASGGAGLGPEASDPQPEASDPQETPPPPPPTGTPYGHVVPSDVGKTLGVGVIAPVPTVAYTGPNPITADGTIVENVIISEQLNIEADDVIIRNCIIDSEPGGQQYAVNVESGDGALIEYNYIHVKPGGKQTRSAGQCHLGQGNCAGTGKATNITWRRNEMTGGTDAIYLNETTGLLVEDNYIHSMRITGSEHMDVFQAGNYGHQPHPGIGSTITIRGNYIDIDNPVVQPPYLPPITGPNEIYFVHGWYTVLFENNFLMPWGGFTIRITPNTEAVTTVRYNVYANEMKDFYSCPGCEFRRAISYADGGGHNGTYECNRYEDGSFIETSLVGGNEADLVNGGVTRHITTGCPSYR